VATEIVCVTTNGTAAAATAAPATTPDRVPATPPNTSANAASGMQSISRSPPPQSRRSGAG